ncbi:MAG: helix-turn-helix transcriptional regulator [Promethearchaeota archaeon]
MPGKFVIDDETVSQISLNSQKASTRIIEFIATHPDSAVSDIAGGTNLSESAIRYALIDLLALGVISESYSDNEKPRSRGRPPQLYRLQKALITSTPPRRYWQLADLLISTLLQKYGEKNTIELFKDMGTLSAHDTATQWKQNHRIPMSINTFRKKLSEALHRLGYNASLTFTENRIIIRTHNCLYQEVSYKYEGLMCHFHNSYYPTLFTLMCDKPARAVERVSCMSHGDDGCQLEIHL